jgi:hypothetical protein
MARSVMQHQFSLVPSVEIPRSVFNRSHSYKTTLNAGFLVPFLVDEVLPGDSISLNATLFGRLATPIVPIMDNVFMETFYFFVPNRLVWDNWRKLCGEQDKPGDSTDYLVPQLTAPAGGWTVGSLADYFGIPIGVGGLKVNALPFRAYNLIYNEWFRDENLCDPVTVVKDDYGDNPSMYNVLRRGKRHDYFTSCLPFPQKGPGVELPLSGNAPVYGTGKALGLTSGTNTYGLAGSGQYLKTSIGAYGMDVGEVDEPGSSSPQRVIGVVQSGESGLYADMTEITAATINSLREAFQLQRLYERDARGGSRYTEIVRSHFGVISPDARLQRPEFLGGSSVRININPVQQTSATDPSVSPQGNLAAFGVVSDSGRGFSKSFTEHGFVIGLVNVRADLTYQQGLRRMWSRRTRFDHYWPALAHLGEQAVLNKEIYAQGTEDDDKAFGYQERWAEYRYFPSQITGMMRSTAPLPLDKWHLSQQFESLPKLNKTFIEDNPPMERVVAVTNQPHLLLDVYVAMRCARPMPVYSVPGLIDHL